MVCSTRQEFMNGLQGYPGLSDDQGMWFPYFDESASVHMASVTFPIDVIFFRGDRIAKIVANIQPGTPGIWSLDPCDGVLEMRGGWCSSYGVPLGARIKVASPSTP
jgi:uncharacterized membrane protein (UPF0127 family)